jgi:hypothetical protein
LQRIDHDVSNEANSFARDAFGKQVVVGIRRRSKQQIRNLIRQQSIDLFRHRAIATAQTRFNVRDLYSEFHTNESTRDRGVYIADDQHPVRLFTQHHGFESLHHCRGLYSV